jgi:molybdenum cofactor guanylyltransferase
MSVRYPDITGVILAGGHNSRMGHHKAFIQINSERLIDRTRDVLRKLFEEVIIVTNRHDDFQDCKDVRVEEDLLQDQGPLAGLYTGLKQSSHGSVFAVACDMPFVQSAAIEALLTSWQPNVYDCIVPRTSRGTEPLHALYRGTVCPFIEQLLAEGKRSVHSLLEKCRCHYVDVDDRHAESFVNINTPDDLNEVLHG